MNLQWAGLVLAIVSFSTIGIGHVAVRWLNFHFGTKPAATLIFLGLVSLVTSLVASCNLVSAVFGIIGITTLWDSYELFRQEERIRRGHAPANPHRPVEASQKQQGDKP
jgi:hypothetical protein